DTLIAAAFATAPPPSPPVTEQLCSDALPLAERATPEPALRSPDPELLPPAILQSVATNVPPSTSTAWVSLAKNAPSATSEAPANCERTAKTLAFSMRSPSANQVVCWFAHTRQSAMTTVDGPWTVITARGLETRLGTVHGATSIASMVKT